MLITNDIIIGDIMLFLTLKQQVPEIEEIQHLKLNVIKL